MRKMINRKGFSLVELMVVVVIMGILIAVAVPLYGAITKNAEKRTCQSNMHSIRTVASKFAYKDNDGKRAVSFFNAGYTNFNGASDSPEAVFKAEFLADFEGSEFPKCPVTGEYYTVVVNANGDVEVRCSNSEH